MGLALAATLLSLRIAISIALLEIMVGVIGGNFLPLQRTEWVNFLAGFGSILLTFLAGAEVEPETKFIFLLLFSLGALAVTAKSEAVLPAYLVGMVLAPFFIANKVLSHRMRIIAFTMLTPFYFLKAGSLVNLSAMWSGAFLIFIFLMVKMAAKFIGVWPPAKMFKFGKKESMYTTLLMSTGLTFGTISALFGLMNKIINQEQYSILVTAVILSAVVPTVIAQKWFQPDIKKKEGNNV